MTPHEPPLQTIDRAPAGAELGPAPEDFRVDEVPAYPFSGEGEHLFVRIEKVSMTTEDAIRVVARAAAVDRRDVGSAGMKDKHAITTQWLSLPGRGAAPPEKWDLPKGISVLEATRHKNKLRTGHLRGNRFQVRIVGAPPDGESRAKAIIDELVRDGLVNYFGAQRFGFGGRNVDEALTWLRQSSRRRDRFHAKLYPSVLQAEVFNRYASARVALGREALAGDVVRLARSASVFVVDDLQDANRRLAERDVMLTGPIFGPKMKFGGGEPARLEGAAIEELGLASEVIAELGRFAQGTRRDLLVYPEDVSIDGEEEAARVGFFLPSGSYATLVVRELTHGPFWARSSGSGPGAPPP